MIWKRHSMFSILRFPSVSSLADVFEIDHPVSIPHPPSSINQCSAFTLMEIMAVITIMAILAGLILGVAGYAARKADQSRAIADMEKIKNALEEYRLVYGLYPTNTVANNSSNWVFALWYKPLHETPRRQPFLVLKGWTDESKMYAALDPWGNDYRYYHDAEGLLPGHVFATNNNSKFGYDLWSEGPDMMESSDNINNWSSRF